MRSPRCVVACAAVALACLAGEVQAQERLSYGPAITLEQAQRVMAAAEAEARRNAWDVVITILDGGGHLVMMQRMDGVQLGSIAVAEQKAYSAVAFRRPTRAFQDALAGPAGNRILSLPGVMPVEGGLPIVIAGQVVGGIGVSGVTAEQDGLIAEAGAAALR